jgi:radical SAM superfamily enzyme YgiQ (UPF0313 family)
MRCLIILLRYNRPTGIFAPQTDKGDYNYNIPVGLAYISAFLKKSGHEIQFLNLNHIDGIVEEIIKDRLSKESFDFVITGGISPFYPEVRSCVESARKYSPNTRIIVGGGLISSQPEIMFNLLQPDYGVIGEGELTIKELFECLENKGDINTVHGLIFRDSEGHIIVTKPRDSIDDLDSLPWPDYDGLGFDEYLEHMLPGHVYYYSIFDNPRVYPVIASRSCPFACTFCFHPLGKKFRKRSIENIMAELEYAVKRYKINIIGFYDELFANDKQRVYDFSTSLTKFLKTVPWEVKWHCQMRVDHLDEEMITLLENSGCYFLSLGLESYSSPVLESMNKKITPAQIDNAIRLCACHNMAITGNFICGDPAETIETYREAIKYLKENEDILKNQVSMGLINLFQGAPIYKRALEKGIIKDEIAFINERAAKGILPLNFTDKMTDEEFQLMQEDIDDAMLVSRRYSEPLLDKEINGVREVHIKCPYCKNISVYRNVDLSPDILPVLLSCRKCNARIIIPSEKMRINILIYRILGSKNGRTFIWHASRLKGRLKSLKQRIFNLLLKKE